ncbi:hypothetical protein ACA910_011528 [Epithemia clementina (nom. ined.)]
MCLQSKEDATIYSNAFSCKGRTSFGVGSGDDGRLHGIRHEPTSPHHWTGRYLHWSSYGGFCTTFHHVFCLQNPIRFLTQLGEELGNLYKVFSSSEQPPPAAAQQPAGGGGRVANINMACGVAAIMKEGKDPLSVNLYKSVSGWLLDWGTLDSMFAHCFLVLS